MKVSKIFYFLCLCILIVCIGCKSGAVSKSKSGEVTPLPAELTGDVIAPNFTLPKVNGEDFNLYSMKKKIIILDLWATWCPPCRKGIPEFIELYDKYKNKGVEIVGVSLDRNGKEKVKDFIEKYGINYTVVMGNDEVVINYGGIRGIPTAFIINRDKKIVKKYEGYIPKEVFEEEIKKLL